MNISKQAIEAGAKGMYLRYNSVRPSPAWEELPENTRMVYREQFAAGLTAALEHIIPHEDELRSAFHKAYGSHNGKHASSVDAGISAVLSHLRGEGKQAEASAPPTVEECLTVEPNPDDVERVARAMFDRAAWKCGWKVGWDGQTEETRDSYRDAATAAIRAMNGQLWGVWDNERNEWMKMPGSETDFTTTCTAAATCVCCVQPNKSLRILPYKATESGIVVCVSEQWNKDLITSKLCVRDNTGSVRAWIQNTGDEEGDYEIAKAVDARLRLASVAAEVRPYTARERSRRRRLR